ncbi:MAG: hypothetical protein MJ005_03445 [Methanocorpusculum sp.]|nr:hypothetical protein [Methanocorpusculum sp.]
MTEAGDHPPIASPPPTSPWELPQNLRSTHQRISYRGILGNCRQKRGKRRETEKTPVPHISTTLAFSFTLYPHITQCIISAGTIDPQRGQNVPNRHSTRKHERAFSTSEPATFALRRRNSDAILPRRNTRRSSPLSLASLTRR